MEQFLGWFDDANKKPVQTKIEEAVERFTYKFGYSPDVCLVSPQDAVEIPGLNIRPTRHIRPNYFWVGREDMNGVELADEAGTQPRPTAAPPRRLPNPGPRAAGLLPCPMRQLPRRRWLPRRPRCQSVAARQRPPRCRSYCKKPPRPKCRSLSKPLRPRRSRWRKLRPRRTAVEPQSRSPKSRRRSR